MFDCLVCTPGLFTGDIGPREYKRLAHRLKWFGAISNVSAEQHCIKGDCRCVFAEGFQNCL